MLEESAVTRGKLMNMVAALAVAIVGVGAQAADLNTLRVVEWNHRFATLTRLESCAPPPRPLSHYWSRQVYDQDSRGCVLGPDQRWRTRS